MPGVRFRFVASSVLVLFLSAAGALAGPAGVNDADSAQTAPATAAVTQTPADDSQPVIATPDADAASVTAAPAEAATPPASDTPDTSAEQPQGQAPAAATTPDDNAKSGDQPSAATVPAATDTAPAAATPSATPVQTPAAEAAPPASPAAATGETTNPAPAAEAAPATTPSPATAAAATPAADPDAPIAEQLRGLADGKFDRIIGGRAQRTTIDAFYSGRNYAPLWITDGKANARATSAIAYLAHVDADGLYPSDYPVPDFASAKDPAALAAAELRLSAAVITYTHHAAIGRVHWTRVSGDIYYDRKAPDPADVLAKMAEAKDAAAALDSYEPHAPGYLALKKKLAEIRADKIDFAKSRIAGGPVLKTGMQDARVPKLRERLGLADADGTTYDKALADAVKKFQHEHDMRATGTLTQATLEALNGKIPDRPADIIIANMERWRWMPHQLGSTYVMVNLPDFTLRVMRDGREVWKTRIVDGKPATPTPIMSSEMKFITVNPTWNVPPSIVAKDYMPALERDPTVLQRMGLNVSRNPDGTVHISQPPGDRNALGRVRFNFPNKFLVYQHDTPDKYLFAYDRRAYSHGCMRVQNPVKYAEVLLALVRPGDGYTEERIRRMFGPNEDNIQFPHFIPVHLTYQTAFVDADGNLQFRDDMYGRDKELLAILTNPEERKVADIPIERKENTVRRELLAMPEPSFFGHSLFGGFGSSASSASGYGYGSGASDGGGGGFFARLFGAPTAPPAPVVRHRVSRRHVARRAERRTDARQ